MPQRSLRAFVLALAYACLTVVACGRATLEGYEFDGTIDGSVVDGGRDVRTDGEGGADARDAADGRSDADADSGFCGPSNCPNGCCNAAGQCITGNTLNACGSGGLACEDCQAQGFDFCDPQRRTCARDVNACNLATCADGCCRATSPRCLSGESNQACGDNASACVVCQPGESCNPATKRCEVIQPCGPGTCDGCCDGNGVCRIGQENSACGAKGMACESCPFGMTCGPLGPIGGFCEGPPPCEVTCFNGCCLGNICVPGNTNTACGNFAQVCQNCSAFGQVCNQQQCQTAPPQCNPTTCPNGCCQGNQCRSGTAQNLCGNGGQACQNCNVQGRLCQGQACVQTCNAQTCPDGCCNGNQCVTGASNTACGTGGITCQNCTAIGETCQNKACSPPPCNAQTCPTGCCNGNQCVTGSSDTLCGTGGVACQNCSAQGNVCSGQKTCIPECNGQNCPGCCDTIGVCNAGFVNNKCGSGGAACANCTAQSSTCNITATPRVCSNQPSDCPATYGACPAGITTGILPQQTVCTAQQLADARAACAPGPNSASCLAYFQFIQTAAPACGACLDPFHFQFTDGTGLFNCVAPFVNAQCRRNTGCATDCLDKSCGSCPAGSRNQCENTVQQGQCSDEYQAASCVTNGLQGPGSFCNPVLYQGNFGRWLEGVAQFYCAP